MNSESPAWDTRAGTIDFEFPKLRQSTYCPGWLSKPFNGSEPALYQVVAQYYVQGVSTLRVDNLVRAHGIEKIDTSQVNRISKELDVRIEHFGNRPLDGSSYRYISTDARYIKVRDGGDYERLRGGRSDSRLTQMAIDKLSRLILLPQKIGRLQPHFSGLWWRPA